MTALSTSRQLARRRTPAVTWSPRGRRRVPEAQGRGPGRGRGADLPPLYSAVSAGPVSPWRAWRRAVGPSRPADPAVAPGRGRRRGYRRRRRWQLRVRADAAETPPTAAPAISLDGGGGRDGPAPEMAMADTPASQHGAPTPARVPVVGRPDGVHGEGLATEGGRAPRRGSTPRPRSRRRRSRLRQRRSACRGSRGSSTARGPSARTTARARRCRSRRTAWRASPTTTRRGTRGAASGTSRSSSRRPTGAGTPRAGRGAERDRTPRRDCQTHRPRTDRGRGGRSGEGRDVRARGRPCGLRVRGVDRPGRPQLTSVSAYQVVDGQRSGLTWSFTIVASGVQSLYGRSRRRSSSATTAS